MSLISDDFRNKKLKENKINIKTKYIVDNNIYERNTDGSVNDDIQSGIRCKKEYYLNNNLIHKETMFDSRIEYTFISKEMENKNYKCINCGMEGKLKDFTNGCPYCRTYYNIDYTDKDLGSKYHYDRVLKNNKYRIITGLIDLIISIIISFIFITTTSRTFNSIDIVKIFIYGFILALILYYWFYILDAYIVLGPIKKYKDKQNQRQIDFWNKTKFNKKTFFNNFNYEIRKYFYSKENVIDFDIIDYLELKDFKKKNTQYVKVLVEIRIVYFENNKIKSTYSKEEYILRKNEEESIILNDGTNMIKCHNCGASIDVTKGICEHCRTKMKYFQEWFLEI